MADWWLAGLPGDEEDSQVLVRATGDASVGPDIKLKKRSETYMSGRCVIVSHPMAATNADGGEGRMLRCNRDVVLGTKLPTGALERTCGVSAMA